MAYDDWNGDFGYTYIQHMAMKKAYFESRRFENCERRQLFEPLIM